LSCSVGRRVSTIMGTAWKQRFVASSARWVKGAYLWQCTRSCSRRSTTGTCPRSMACSSCSTRCTFSLTSPLLLLSWSAQLLVDGAMLVTLARNASDHKRKLSGFGIWDWGMLRCEGEGSKVEAMLSIGSESQSTPPFTCGLPCLGPLDVLMRLISAALSV
jgi:hypothetical protein